ncbi:MAG: DUF4272 domain-containing protein [Chloroflexota bacterium]|nr:DUF4272 domain-containing protein [Chloroflexota bacterium]
MAHDQHVTDELDINPRSPAEVAGRLLALVGLARRGFLEQPLEMIADDTPAAERYDLLSWLDEERLADFLTPPERAILNAPIGSLSPEDTAAITWGIEGAAVLAWALQSIPELAEYDEVTNAVTVIEVLPATWSRTTEFRTAAMLRDEPDIAQARERAEVWHDRADLYWMIQGGWEDEDDEPRAIVRLMADEAHAAGLIAAPIAGDFVTRGGVYHDLAPDTVETLELIAFHRLVEFNWLCGLIDHD